MVPFEEIMKNAGKWADKVEKPSKAEKQKKKCDPPPRNESKCAKPTFAGARNLLQGCENVFFEILVLTA